MPLPTEVPPEAQDRAETLDETNLTEDGGEIANFDAIDDVYDATRAEDDDDIEGYDEEDDAGDFDPAEIRETLAAARDDEGQDIEREALSPRTREEDDGDVPDDKDQSPDFESHTDPSQQVEESHDPHVEEQLDKGLKETFPASDPVSINPGAD
ncbi:MAG: primosomal protein [Pseudomonadota bacterium]